MTTDPLRALISGHERVSEWLSTMWSAAGLLASDDPRELLALQQFLRTHVREHFELEEQVVFPALLELDPRSSVQILVEELRKDHLSILGGCNALFRDLAWAMAQEDSDESIRALHGRARAIIDELLAHAAREDAHLIPLVADHREEIELRML